MQRVTRVGEFSFGKIMGIIGLLVGFFFGVVYGLELIVIGVMGESNGPWGAAGTGSRGIIGGVFVMALVPVLSGALGFVVGLMFGVILNRVLRFVGGLELEIE